jgi:uncharacterized protein YkwD
MQMKVKKIIAILIGLIGCLVAAQSICSAVTMATPEPIGESAYLESLINQARQNPLAMAAMIGKDPEQVIRDFPEKNLILQYGVPPVINNIKLRASASKHGSDVIGNQYFSYRSLDGRKPIDRMQEEGYQVLFSGETLGMMGLYNLINPEDAVWALFKKMFAEELDPDRKDPWVILNPAMSEVGVNVDKGAFLISGRSLNVYLGVCDFGSSRSDIYAAERMLYHSINSARLNPGQGLESVGVSFDDAVASIGKENAWKLIIGLPPLAWNSTLHNVSRAQQIGGVKALEVTDDTSFNVTDSVYFLDRNEYQAVVASEVRLSFYDDNPNLTPVQAAAKLFEQLLASETINGQKGIINIFNESSTEIGTAIEYTTVTGMPGYRWSAVIEFARPVLERQHVVGGLTIIEPDENTPQAVKKKIGRQITLTEIDDKEETEMILPLQVGYTGPLGGYQFEFKDSRSYRLQVLTEGGGAIFNDFFESYHKRNQINDLVILNNNI